MVDNGYYFKVYTSGHRCSKNCKLECSILCVIHKISRLTITSSLQYTQILEKDNVTLLFVTCYGQCFVGFTEGVMLVGDYKGEKVSDAKPKLKNELIESGQALRYSEPEKMVGCFVSSLHG